MPPESDTKDVQPTPEQQALAESLRNAADRVLAGDEVVSYSISGSHAGDQSVSVSLRPPQG
jgi:hypothetical protein